MFYCSIIEDNHYNFYFFSLEYEIFLLKYDIFFTSEFFFKYIKPNYEQFLDSLGRRFLCYGAVLIIEMSHILDDMTNLKEITHLLCR